ncbi:unnamed protein product [Lactuca saligna]|uniref:beta-ketoacyl-[acyl-carrier-protein] synthase I n=1 Tax=Lactuca saligna TaxID=75948 RepID=A0AA35V2Z0_LACSI|nr:unnamed protein product [Lactuca saligna]
MKHLRIEEETRIRHKRGKVGQSVHHVSAAGSSSHKGKSGGQNKKNFGPKKQSFKKPGHQNPNSKPKRAGPWHVCGEIGHYARECKDRKSIPVAHAVEKVTDMVASVNLGEIFMISSLTREICARGWFVDTGAIVHVCGQRESFRTYQPMPHGMVVVCAYGHRAEVLGRSDVRLTFTRGEWVTLRDVLHVPTISKGLVSADKFDKGGFKMVLERGKIVITKARRYVGRANNTSGMYRLCLRDEGNMSGPSVESGVASVSSVGMGGMSVFSDASDSLMEGGYEKISPLFTPYDLQNMTSVHHLGFMGPAYSISAACATSNFCFCAAANHIREGEADLMIAGGSEAALNPIGVASLAATNALSKRNHDPQTARRPWDKDRNGFVIGEGAGVLVMESLEHAMKRGAPILAEFLGGAVNCDAYHVTNPRPDGFGVSSCIQMSL